jgi:hypothetical protein
LQVHDFMLEGLLYAKTAEGRLSRVRLRDQGECIRVGVLVVLSTGNVFVVLVG